SLAFDDGAKEDDGVADPDNGNQNINRPLQLSVLFSGGVTHGQSDDRKHYHQLPAPEGKRHQPATEQGRLTGPLDHIIGSGKQGTAAKVEAHRISMQRAQPTEVGVRLKYVVQFRPDQLGRNQYTDSHPNRTPNDGHDGELAYDFVIVDRMVSGYCRITAHRTFPMRKRKGLRSRKKVYPAQILPTPGASLCAKESVSILILIKLILRDNAPLITDPSRWLDSG